MISVPHIHNYDTVANLTTDNPIVYSGEIRIAYDGVKPKIKIGDENVGLNFNDLDYFGEVGIGGAIVGGTAGSILYVDASGNLGQDNTKFHYDEINKFFGLGIIPSYQFHLKGLDTTAIAFYLESSAAAQSFAVYNSGKIQIGNNQDYISSSSNSGYFDYSTNANGFAFNKKVAIGFDGIGSQGMLDVRGVLNVSGVINKIDFYDTNYSNVYHRITSDAATGYLDIRSGETGGGHIVRIVSDNVVVSTFTNSQVNVFKPQNIYVSANEWIYSRPSGQFTYQQYSSQAATGFISTNPQGDFSQTIDSVLIPTGHTFGSTSAGGWVNVGQFQSSGGGVRYYARENGTAKGHIWYQGGVQNMNLTTTGDLEVGLIAKIYANGQMYSSLYKGRGALDYINTENNAWSVMRLDNTTGNLTVWQSAYFGGNVAPTAYVDIAASTVLKSSFRMRSGIVPTSPNAGDVSYDGAFKGWNGSSWLTFGGGGGGISIGDTITGGSADSILYYNGGLAQHTGLLKYNSATTTFFVPTIKTDAIHPNVGSVINFYSLSGTLQMKIDAGGVYSRGTNWVTSNTAFGEHALAGASVANNTAFGYYALASGSLSGQYNTAIGTDALRTNTTGFSNNAFGRLALGNNSTGFNNMAMGHTALWSNTTGAGNVAIGLDALRKATGAHYNVAIGTSALFGGSSPSGQFNIGIGYSALENYTSGQWNIAIGTLAGGGITSGSYNTLIGKLTGLIGSMSNTIILADGQGNRGIEWTSSRFIMYGDTFSIPTDKTPASAGASGIKGDIVFDADYLYRCVAFNTWKRSPLLTW